MGCVSKFGPSKIQSEMLPWFVASIQSSAQRANSQATVAAAAMEEVARAVEAAFYVQGVVVQVVLLAVATAIAATNHTVAAVIAVDASVVASALRIPLPVPPPRLLHIVIAQRAISTPTPTRTPSRPVSRAARCRPAATTPSSVAPAEATLTTAPARSVRRTPSGRRGATSVTVRARPATWTPTPRPRRSPAWCRAAPTATTTSPGAAARTAPPGTPSRRTARPASRACRRHRRPL